MPSITPHLWFDTEAVEAARFYVGILPGSRITSVVTVPDTPSGDVDTVGFELAGQPFVAISAGPMVRFNPTTSFAVTAATAEEVDRYWSQLSAGGTVLMELGRYPFSERYGWTTDRYGLSWQVSLASDGDAGTRIVPTLLFSGDVHGRAADALRHYTTVFPDSGVDLVVPYDDGPGDDRDGRLSYAAFRLAGQPFAAMDGTIVDDPGAGFNEAVSFLVEVDDQDGIDRYSDALSAVPEAERCGWIKDRFGLSWQIAPVELGRMMTTGDADQVARVTAAFLDMRRLDLGELRRAYGDAAAAPS